MRIYRPCGQSSLPQSASLTAPSSEGAEGREALSVSPPARQRQFPCLSGKERRQRAALTERFLVPDCAGLQGPLSLASGSPALPEGEPRGIAETNASLIRASRGTRSPLSLASGSTALPEGEPRGKCSGSPALPEGESSRFFDTLDSPAIWPGNFCVFGGSFHTVHVDGGKPEHSRYNNVAGL